MQTVQAIQEDLLLGVELGLGDQPRFQFHIEFTEGRSDGLAFSGQFLLGRIVAHVKTRTFPQVFADCTFCLAELGSEAGVIGACTVAAIELPHRH